MTRENREGLKIIALAAAIVLLWFTALTAVMWIGGALDDGMAAAPSRWRN